MSFAENVARLGNDYGVTLSARTGNGGYQYQIFISGSPRFSNERLSIGRDARRTLEHAKSRLEYAGHTLLTVIVPQSPDGDALDRLVRQT